MRGIPFDGSELPRAQHELQVRFIRLRRLERRLKRRRACAVGFRALFEYGGDGALVRQHPLSSPRAGWNLKDVGHEGNFELGIGYLVFG